MIATLLLVALTSHSARAQSIEPAAYERLEYDLKKANSFDERLEGISAYLSVLSHEGIRPGSMKECLRGAVSFRPEASTCRPNPGIMLFSGGHGGVD